MSRQLRLSRRQLLAGTSRLAFLEWLGPFAALATDAAGHEPWFDDGTDWID